MLRCRIPRPRGALGVTSIGDGQAGIGGCSVAQGLSRIIAQLGAAAVLALAAAPGAAQLRAGTARVSITPDPRAMPHRLGGYVSPVRLNNDATGVHDTCFARALVLENGSARAALVSLDLCFLPAAVKEAVAAHLRDTGIPPAALFLSATHTHSALDPLHLHPGNTGHQTALPRYDAKLSEWMAERIAQAVRDAAGRMVPARAGSAQRGRVGLNRNRRGEQLTDDELTALKVVDAQDRPVAAVVCYAAHPVYYGAEMLEVSGDWSGSLARKLEAEMPGATVLFLNGAEGDASPDGADEGTPAERIDVYSAKLAAAARKALDAAALVPDPRLEAWTQDAEPGDPTPHPLFLLASVALRATPDQARALVRRMMPQRIEATFVRIGDLLLMGLPGEPTAAVGLEAKRLARERGVRTPAVVALTNGWLGYLVTEAQYRAGEYEATMSFYGPEIGARMLDAVRRGLERRTAGTGRP